MWSCHVAPRSYLPILNSPFLRSQAGQETDSTPIINIECLAHLIPTVTSSPGPLNALNCTRVPMPGAFIEIYIQRTLHNKGL